MNEETNIIGYIVEVNDITLTVDTANDGRVVFPKKRCAIDYMLSLVAKAEHLCQKILERGYEYITYRTENGISVIDEEKSIRIEDPDSYHTEVSAKYDSDGSIQAFSVILYCNTHAIYENNGGMAVGIELPQEVRRYDITLRSLIQYNNDDDDELIRKLHINIVTNDNIKNVIKTTETTTLRLPNLPETTIYNYNKEEDE